LFGKKKEPEVQESKYEIFGGFTITKKPAGYNITWRSPNLTTITVPSMPLIDENIERKSEGDKIQVTCMECKLRVITKEGKTEAHISKI